MIPTRCERFAVLCAAILLLLPFNVVRAIEFSWDNFSGDSNWDTRINWNPYPNPPNVPRTGDIAIFDGLLAGSGVGNNTVNLPNSAVDRMRIVDTAVVDMTIGDGTRDSQLYLNDVLFDDALVVGDSSGDTATFNLLGGRLYSYRNAIGGQATMNIINPGSYWDTTYVRIDGDTTANTAGVGLGLGRGSFPPNSKWAATLAAAGWSSTAPLPASLTRRCGTLTTCSTSAPIALVGSILAR